MEMPYGGYGSGLDGHAARYGGQGGEAPPPPGATVSPIVPDAAEGAIVQTQLGPARTVSQGEALTETTQSSIQAPAMNIPVRVRVTQPAPNIEVIPDQPTPVALPPPPPPVPVVPCGEPVRWVCFKRINKLIFFGVLFIIAAITIILLFVISGTSLQIAIIVLMALVAVLMIVEYLWLGTDCAVDPATGSMTCKARLV